MDEEQKQYELVCILPPQLEGANLENTKKDIEKAVANFGGTINFGKLEKHILAYPINKQGQGIFLISQLSISPEKIGGFSKELKLNKQVLRHLINQVKPVKIESKKPKRVIKKEKVKLEEIDKKLDEIIEEI